ASDSRRWVRLRNSLVTAQIALSTILLCLGASILDNLTRTLNTSLGFQPEQVVIAGIGIPETTYDTDDKVIDIHERIIERLGTLAGVSEAAAGANVPYGRRVTFQPTDKNLPKKDRPVAVLSFASPNLLHLLRVPLLKGRGFTKDDRSDRPLVALVNRKF